MKNRTLPLALLLLAALGASPAGALAQTRRQSSAPPSAADCVARQGELPKSWNGQAFAIDGDTLAGIGLRPHIRVWGIQAPELRDAARGETPPGMRARAALEDLLALGDHTTSCKVLKWDRYCRIVAQCSVTPSGIDLPAAPDAKATKGPPIDLGAWMLGLGMAYGFYLDDAIADDPDASRRYAAAEREARREKRGLWPVWLGER